MEILISFTTLVLSRLKKVVFFVEDVTIKSYIVCSFKCAPTVEELMGVVQQKETFSPR